MRRLMSGAGGIHRVLHLVVAGLLMASSALAGDLQISKGGAAEAVIVHGGKPAHAAIIQEYLKKMTGADFQVVPDISAVPAGKSAIVLSIVPSLPGTSARRTAEQAYRIRTADGRLEITARTDTGLWYGVYGFLDNHLGMRFFAPKVEMIPSRPDLSVGQIDDTQEPAFTSRKAYPFNDNPQDIGHEWTTKNRGLGKPFVLAHHTFSQFIPPDKYFDSHPEWFSMVGGIRAKTWAMGLCGTNEELAKEMARNLMEKMATTDPSDDPIRCGQGDGFTGCECEPCRELVRKEESEAAPLMLMLNRALEITKEKYPNHKIATFAYCGTLKAPKTMRPHPNLCYNIVSGDLYQNTAGDQMGCIKGNPANAHYQAAMETWPKLCGPDQVGIWHWAFGDGMAEDPNLFSVCEDIRFMHENKIGSIFLQMSYYPKGSWDWLRRWVYYRMMWDPKQDPEALVREFLEGYYGREAAPHLWKYLQTVSKLAKSMRPWSETRWTRLPEYMQYMVFTPARLTAMDQLVTAAEKAAAREKDPAFAERVAHVRWTTLDYYQLVAGGALARAKDPRDGSEWLVPGGRPDMIARLERANKEVFRTATGDAPDWWKEYQQRRRFGGKLAPFASSQLSAAYLPYMDGRMVSLVHLPTGRELLGKRPQTGLVISPNFSSRRGYGETIAGVNNYMAGVTVDEGGRTIPGEEVKVADGRTATIKIDIRPDWWYMNPPYTYALDRTVSLDANAPKLSVSRTYLRKGKSEKALLSSPLQFSCEWPIAIADPAKASVKVTGGGAKLSKTTAEMFSGQTEKIEIAGGDEKVVVEVDRGDGLTVVLSAKASELKSVTLTFEMIPILRESIMAVTFADKPLQIDPKAETSVALPSQELEVRVASGGAAPLPQLPIEAYLGKANPPDINKYADNKAVNRRDDIELVLVPAGEFKRGSPDTEGWEDEWPAGNVYLDGYWISKTPVTVAQFRKFAEETGRTMPDPRKWWQYENARPEDPVEDFPVLVSWYDAMAYARWAGGTLPTDAQWEKAARGTDGRRYPWGNEWDPSKAAWIPESLSFIGNSTYVHPISTLANFAPSPFGAEGMAGNVFEWVADWFNPDMNRLAAPKAAIGGFRADLQGQPGATAEDAVRNPKGPAEGSLKVLRGGDEIWDYRFSRCAARMAHPPHVQDWIRTGFRYVVPAEPAGK